MKLDIPVSMQSKMSILRHLCSVSPSLNLFPFPILLSPFPSPFPLPICPPHFPFPPSPFLYFPSPSFCFSYLLLHLFSNPLSAFPFPFSLLPFPLPCPPLLSPPFFPLCLTDKFEPYPERDCYFFFRISKKYMMEIMTELYMNTEAKPLHSLRK